MRTAVAMASLSLGASAWAQQGQWPASQPQPPTTQASRAAATPSSRPAVASSAAANEPPTHAQPISPDAAKRGADAALAERLSAIAHGSLPGKMPPGAVGDAIWMQVATMMSAAHHLTVNESGMGDPRLARLTADAFAQAHDDDGQLRALYEAKYDDSHDQGSVVRIIDLFASRMQTASDKLNYLQQMFQLQTLPAPVRAHAGAEAARLLLERGEPDAGQKALEEALRLDSLCGAALRLKYATLPANASAYQRETALLSLLRANPDQPAYAVALADLLADAGLAPQAVTWYRLAISITSQAGNSDLNAARDAITEMLLADQAPDAEVLADQLVKVQPQQPSNWFLKLAAMHGNVSNDDYQLALQQARNAISNRVVEAVNAIGGKTGPQATTRPLSDPGPYPLPDLALAAAQLNQSGAAPAKEQFVMSVADLATLELLFAQQPPAAAKLIDALSAVLPANDPRLVRLSGWSQLLQGQDDAARSRLQSIAGADPLAQAALIRLQAKDPAQHQAAAAAARRLLSQHPSGIVAAIVLDQLHSLDPHILVSDAADKLQTAADAFPTSWLRVLDAPQDFYAIHADPINVARSFGDALLARVTLQNLTDVDLTIGSDGVLRPALLLGAVVRGVDTQNFPGAGFDELAGPLVLPARQAMSQVVRLDQGALAQYLDNDPNVAMQVFGSAQTNPIPGAQGNATSGPAGYSVQFTRVFSRLAAPAGSPAEQQAMADLDSSSAQRVSQDSELPRRQISDLQLLSRYVQILRAAKAPTDQQRSDSAKYLERLHNSRSDPTPAVAAWASYLSCLLADPSQKPQMLDDMSVAADWRQREMALVASFGNSPATQRLLADRLKDDPEPSVRSLARARRDYLQLAAKQPPTTKP